MELKGKIVAVLERKSGVSKTGKDWESQEFVMELDGDSQYTKHFCFNVFGTDKLESFDLKIGDNINVECDVDAKEFKGRWYNQFNAFRVYKAQQKNANQSTNQNSQQSKPRISPKDLESNDSDMPF